jgi:hypothetical protein
MVCPMGDPVRFVGDSAGADVPRPDRERQVGIGPGIHLPTRLPETDSHSVQLRCGQILGGPNWLEMDRFDVIAKVPADSTPETQKLMLQSLLADRFKLVIHRTCRRPPVRPRLHEC